MEHQGQRAQTLFDQTYVVATLLRPRLLLYRGSFEEPYTELDVLCETEPI